MSNPEEIGKAFVDHYYRTFDSNRSQLQSLYQEQSMLTFEGQQFQGAQNILQKLTSLPFQNCAHRLTTLDVQPSLSSGIIIFVTGYLKGSFEINFIYDFLRFSAKLNKKVVTIWKTDGESNELKFSQVFHLVPIQGSFAVSNDLFRLNYG